MAPALLYKLDTATTDQIATHLTLCDACFIPPLSGRVEIAAYATKIAEHARRFEAWGDGVLAGLVAAYIDEGARAFITSVSVLPAWSGRGVATALLARCATHARSSGALELTLEVGAQNTAAISLYRKAGFGPAASSHHLLTMTLSL